MTRIERLTAAYGAGELPQLYALTTRANQPAFLSRRTSERTTACAQDLSPRMTAQVARFRMSCLCVEAP